MSNILKYKGLWEEDLKPCPFCGGEAEIEKKTGFDRKIIGAWVTCSGCGANTLTYSTEKVAIEAWNKRVSR